MCKKISIAFRSPAFPVLFIDNNILIDSFYNINDLCLKLSEYDKEDNEIIILDSSSEEFWYVKKNEDRILAPGFMLEKWKKKEIIELYNKSNNGKKESYNKNINNIKLSDLIKDISAFMQKNK